MSTANFPVQFQSHDSDLERTTSAHSSHTATSSNAPASTNAHSAGSAMTDLMTPVYHPEPDYRDEELTENEMDEMYAESDAARARLAKLGTRSMQSFRQGKGRERSMTDAKPMPFVVDLPLPASPPHPSPIIQSKPAKTSGGFSAFLRRLAGKAPKKSKQPAPQAPTVRQIPPPAQRQNSAPAVAVSRPIVMRQATAPAAPLPRQSILGQSRSVDSLRGHVGQSLPTASSTSTIPESVDPADIPLPPSPVAESEEVLSDPALPTVSQKSSRRGKSPMMSFEGFEIEEEDETDEEADQVRPLKPLRITVNNVQYSTSPDSAPLKSSSSIETTIQTPTSAVSTYGYSGMSESGSSPEYHMANGDSPPRQGPVSTGSVLDRKGSKWRKSVMGGASDSGVLRKQTTRMPFSSSDAYSAKQRRLASNRVSCQPTLHNNTSITAGLTTIKSKEEAEVAETFFLS